jgi:ribulose-phosphate 3-epimerase
MKKIIPAILTKDIADLENKLGQIQGLANWVQIDIMDGTLVNNTSITIEDISRAKLTENFSLEAHLMVLHPETYFLQCQKSNIKRVIFHIEAGNTKNILSKAQMFDFQKGLALNPETSIEKIIPYLGKIDVILLMSVNPGFGGQEFILETLDKIRELKKIAPKIKIEVDGGINIDNIKMISDAGADYFVMGSGLFKGEHIEEYFKELQLKI